MHPCSASDSRAVMPAQRPSKAPVDQAKSRFDLGTYCATIHWAPLNCSMARTSSLTAAKLDSLSIASAFQTQLPAEDVPPWFSRVGDFRDWIYCAGPASARSELQVVGACLVECLEAKPETANSHSQSHKTCKRRPLSCFITTLATSTKNFCEQKLSGPELAESSEQLLTC